ncbi:MAG: hypothetical protein IIA14_10365, partial [SAR324 cluster bacterium]|nr:hypothetical protein [SAR324 cluster bacterium]
MLEIDYSLIPLSDEDRKLVDEEITRKLREGEVPRIDKTHFGRVVVLNPDPVQTVHHVPDDLRAHMRRIMVPTMEGPLSLGAERLFQELTDPEEPLHFLIVELKSKFTHFPEFLRYLPRLRRRYPSLGVFLATDRATLLEKLRELMTEGRIRLDLVYPDARGVVELADPAELGETLSAQEEPVTFATPFFSQIRLMIGPENRPVVHNLDTLRRLHSQFGVGEAKEIDVGGGRTEKLIVIDIPIRIIRDFQFRQDRGLDFEGITRNGRKILSRRFDQEKLEYRWIPLSSIESFHRRVPGGSEQTVSIAGTRVLRVNCFNGQVSFIARTPADQISLEDVRTLRFRGLPPPVVSDGEENPPPPSEDDYRIDRLLLPSTGLSDSDPVQEAVRDHFYRRIFGEEMERARKLEVYTRGLVVGSVGPLAAQTVKLLRRHGLEGLIDPAGFHYLCDSAQQIPDFAQTVERFGERLTGLIESLRKITARDAEGEMRISDFIHNLPLTMEWVDGPGIRYDQAAPQELEVIYREMGTLTRFIAQEFQRTFDIGEAQIAFFQKIHACQEAALVAMWLADFKRGAYGPPLPAGREVDFIFFGTPAEKSENDRTHFFPGLACSEFFRSAQNQQRFARVDYSFSIFFQEQLALAEHHFREGGDFSISLEQYGQFFEQKAAEARQELDGLKGDMAAIDSTDSPEYLRLLREEEKAYHQRYQAFLQDRDRVAEDHRLADEGLLEQVRGMGADFVFASDPDPKWFEGAEPDPGIFDQDLLASLGKTEEKLRRDFDERREVATAKLLEGVANVRATMEAISAAHQKNRDWQLGLQPRRIAEQQALAHGKVAGRTSALKRLAKAALEGHHKRVGVQRRELEAEIRRMNAKIALHERTSVQSIQSMEAVVGRALNPFEELERLGREPPAQAIRHIEGLAKRLEEISRTLQSLSVKLGRNMEQFQTLLARGHRLAGFQFAISLEEGLLAAAEEKKIPELPPPRK